MFYRKRKLVELVDELIRVFDDGNRSVCRRLIALRHRVRNVVDPEALEEGCRAFADAHAERLAARDASVLFRHAPYCRSDIETIWSELSASNRDSVWRWIDSILAPTGTASKNDDDVETPDSVLGENRFH